MQGKNGRFMREDFGDKQDAVYIERDIDADDRIVWIENYLNNQQHGYTV